jgi:hypothetical protein
VHEANRKKLDDYQTRTPPDEDPSAPAVPNKIDF